MPDLRGLFLRGLGGNSAGLRMVQQYEIQSHNHRVLSQGNPGWGVAGGWTNILGYSDKLFSTDYSGGVETRPINMAVRYLVRALP